MRVRARTSRSLVHSLVPAVTGVRSGPSQQLGTLSRSPMQVAETQVLGRQLDRKYVARTRTRQPEIGSKGSSIN